MNTIGKSKKPEPVVATGMEARRMQPKPRPSYSDPKGGVSHRTATRMGLRRKI